MFAAQAGAGGATGFGSGGGEHPCSALLIPTPPTPPHPRQPEQKGPGVRPTPITQPWFSRPRATFSAPPPFICSLDSNPSSSPFIIQKSLLIEKAPGASHK